VLRLDCSLARRLLSGYSDRVPDAPP
jgi:hypothetical protein